MSPLFRALASLKLTIALLIVIAAMLSFGTILETLRGAEAAKAVYYAPWFFGLQGLFALNLLVALWDRWPRNRFRIGFAITHTSMIVILAGALMTYIYSVEGHLPLYEGESATAFLKQESGGHESHYALPFTIRLDAYEMDFYPGTDRPAMFRSRVMVVDAGGAGRPGVIQMNHPLTHRGFRFFQSSYNLEGGRRMSILSVSKDPGEPVVFFGYYLLVFGMIVVLITRIAQFREAERVKAMRSGGRAAGLNVVAVSIAVAGLLLAAAPRGALAAQLPPAAAISAVRGLPVQVDGREAPFDTQAREAVRSVTGQPSWQGIDPVVLTIGWTIDPHGWSHEPIIKIDAQVAAMLGLAPGTSHASYEALLSSPRLRMLLAEAMQRQVADQKPTGPDKSLVKLDERVRTLDAFLTGEAIRAVPGETRAAAWGVPGNPTALATWTQLESQVRPRAPAFYPTPAMIRKEIDYNAVNPTGIAWWFLLPAAIAAGMTLERDRWKLRGVAALGMVLGFLVMTWGIATRWQLAGRIPASDMYESMLFLGWGVGLFGVVSVLLRNRMLVYNAAAMSALVMLLLDKLPMDPFIRPMAPVLSGTPWLAIHVPIIMVSYSTFAIATFLAHLELGVYAFAPGRRDLAEKWSQLLYWYLMVGSILLIAGILTGSIWAASSWGRYWGWDPKEVWSLVAFLAYMAILHARSDGQMTSFGVAVSSIVAFWTILMTYLGVNFVLGSGMHAYGAGSGHLLNVMGVIALVETAFLLAAWQRKGKPAAA